MAVVIARGINNHKSPFNADFSFVSDSLNLFPSSWERQFPLVAIYEPSSPINRALNYNSTDLIHTERNSYLV